MKKFFAILPTALVVLAAVSCNKEQVIENQGRTFTASMGLTKLGVSDDGKTTWTPGDVIVLYNGNNTAATAFSGGAGSSTNIQVVTVTPEMIAAGGASVTFGVTIPAPEGDSWYAYATDDVNNVKSVDGTGSALIAVNGSVAAGKVPFVAAAKAAKAASSLTFHHAAGLLKMTCSKAAGTVSVTANGGESLLTNGLISFAQDGTVSVADGSDNAASVSVDVAGMGSSDPVYVALYGKSYENGISIKALDGGTVVGEATISKTVTVAAGKMINLGDFIANGQGGDTEVDSWSWTLAWATREKNWDETNFVVKEDNGNGELKFVHTNAAADYKVGTVTDEQIAQTTFCFGEDAAKQGYGYYGGLKNDYWSIKCDGPLAAGTKVNIKFLVMGDNQAMAFWDGAYVIDGAEVNYLPKSDMVYDWGKNANKASSWTVHCDCRYVLAYGPKGNAAGSWAHFVEETITLPSAVTSSFEFRLVIADNVFHKASTAFASRSVASDPLHSLAIVASGTRGSETVTCPAVTVSVVK